MKAELTYAQAVIVALVMLVIGFSSGVVFEFNQQKDAIDFQRLPVQAKQDLICDSSWEMGKQNLIFRADKRLELKVVSEDYSFQEDDYFVYLDSLKCEPHDCSRLTPYYKYYPKAMCLVCDYNAVTKKVNFELVDLEDLNMVNVIFDQNRLSDFNWTWVEVDLNEDNLFGDIPDSFENCKEVNCSCHEWGCLMACYLCPEEQKTIADKQEEV